jgi:hypothetical protein
MGYILLEKGDARAVHKPALKHGSTHKFDQGFLESLEAHGWDSKAFLNQTKNHTIQLKQDHPSTKINLATTWFGTPMRAQHSFNLKEVN